MNAPNPTGSTQLALQPADKAREPKRRIARTKKIQPRPRSDILKNSNILDRLMRPASGPRTVDDRHNAAVGCKTNEVALALLTQIIRLDPAEFPVDTDAHVDGTLATVTAMLGELEPENATQAMLGAQMVGAQRAAMEFLSRALHPEQPSELADRCTRRGVMLMQVFTQQVEMMAKLKGKSGQQRVLVEHVTVAAGGQAIVGAVTSGGSRGGDPEN